MNTRWQQTWRHIAGWAVGLLAVGLIMAGCGGSSAGGSPTTSPNEASIRIAGNYYGQFSFSPASITIKVGTTVVWTNSTSVAHTTTSDAGSAVTWDSGMINPGATFSFTFTQAGTFTYHCNVHPYMHGTVVVTA